jgi:AcrR family transcriptional regulator
MPRKTDRRHRQGDESRHRLLETTLEIAAERGYDGTSVGLVTERSGLPASSVYWHFKNKDELLAETLEFSFRQWRESSPTWEDAEPADVDDAGTFRVEVRRRLRAAGRALLVSPEFWRLGLMLAVERRAKEPAARRRYVEVRDETARAIAGWWSAVLPSDLLEDDATLPDRLARFHLALMDGLFVGRRADERWDVEAMVELMADGMTAYVEAAGATR